MSEKQREHEEQTPQLRPRIWVGSLSDYNAGRLHGAWLDAAQNLEELTAAIQELLATSPAPDAEEWAIFDYEDFGGLRLHEYEDLGVVSTLAAGLTAQGAAFAGWAELVERDPQRLGDFERAFIGRFDSLDAYAEHLFDELGYEQELQRLLPSYLQPYVRLDPAAFARDLEHGGDLLVAPAEGGGVFIYDGSP